MPATCPKNEYFAFLISEPRDTPENSGAYLDMNFLINFPNVIKAANITIPFRSQEYKEDPVITAIRIFGFTQNLQ